MRPPFSLSHSICMHLSFLYQRKCSDSSLQCTTSRRPPPLSLPPFRKCVLPSPNLLPSLELPRPCLCREREKAGREREREQGFGFLCTGPDASRSRSRRKSLFFSRLSLAARFTTTSTYSLTYFSFIVLLESEPYVV